MAKSKDCAALDFLEEAAASWVGTPWCDNSATKGRGACCHLLAGAIYEEAGWIQGMELPRGVALAARWSNRSPILDWLRTDGAKWFEEVPKDQAQPGDLLLMTCGRIPHHLALLLPGNRAVHVTAQRGVEIVPIVPARRRMLSNVFRPRPR